MLSSKVVGFLNVVTLLNHKPIFDMLVKLEVPTMGVVMP